MKKDNNREFINKNLDMIFEFEKYVAEHPDFAKKIPNDAVISLQIEGDEEFNRKSEKLARDQTEKGQSIVFVRVRKLGPIHSRIEDLELKTLQEQ